VGRATSPQASATRRDQPLADGGHRGSRPLGGRHGPATTRVGAGERQAYHAISLGFYEGEPVRRTDPAHRSLGRFFHEEIATPLGFEFYLGLPDAIPHERLAPLEPPSLWKRLTAMPPRLTLAAMNPRSVLSDLAVEVGPALGVRVADVADGGEVQGVVQSAVAALGEPVHDLATRGAFHGCGAVAGGELVAVGEAADVAGEPDQVTGNDRAEAEQVGERGPGRVHGETDTTVGLFELGIPGAAGPPAARRPGRGGLLDRGGGLDPPRAAPRRPTR
jgi:hypothetical protein